MAVGSHFDAMGCDGIIDELGGLMSSARTHLRAATQTTHLIILRGELVQTLLYNMITVQVLDQSDDMHAKGDDDGMDLGIVALISLAGPRGEKKRKILVNLTTEKTKKRQAGGRRCQTHLTRR